MRFFELSDLIVYGCETVLKGSLILAVAALVGILLRKRLPSGAHFVWLLAFCVTIAIPVASAVVPWKSVLFLNLEPTSLNLADHRRDVSGSAGQSANGPTSAIPAAAQLGELSRPAVYQGLTIADWILTAPVVSIAFVLWLIGFLAVTARCVYGFYCLRVIRRFGTNPIASERLAFEADRLAREAGQYRDFDLRVSATPNFPVPMTWGVFRPTIVLPHDAESWSAARFEATLLHELAHIRRFDFLSQVVSEFACALYWFNPTVWLAAGAMRSDAELAADEAVLQAGLRPSDYAAELLLLASDLGKKPIPFATLGTPAMTNSKIETRLESILSPTAGCRGVTSIQTLAAVALAVLAIPTFAALHASSHGQTTEPKDERTLALQRMKQIALATTMYSLDFDNDLPYVQDSASAEWVLQPYMLNHGVFHSPTKGGKFVWNFNLGGVNTKAIKQPATTPMWIEWLPDAKSKIAVGYADGHAKLIEPEEQAELKKASAKHFPRAKAMKPLPANFMVPKKQ